MRFLAIGLTIKTKVLKAKPCRFLWQFSFKKKVFYFYFFYILPACYSQLKQAQFLDVFVFGN